MYTSEYDGILFVEGHPENAKIICHVEAKLHGIFTQPHLKTLDDVKKKIVGDVKSKGGNSLINFKYGQTSSFWSTLIGIDNICWYGSGDVAIIDRKNYAKVAS